MYGSHITNVISARLIYFLKCHWDDLKDTFSVAEKNVFLCFCNLEHTTSCGSIVSGLTGYSYIYEALHLTDCTIIVPKLDAKTALKAETWDVVTRGGIVILFESDCLSLNRPALHMRILPQCSNHGFYFTSYRVLHLSIVYVTCINLQAQKNTQSHFWIESSLQLDFISTWGLIGVQVWISGVKFWW